MTFDFLKNAKKLFSPAILTALLILIALALASRFLYLSKIPTSLHHDEMVYAVHAQSVALSGTDLTGTWNPLSLTPVHPMFAELPAVFQAPFFWLPVEPIVAAKLPFVLMSLILPLILAGISFELFKNKTIAIATALIATFNPWIWQFGRMGFDPYWSLFFLTLGAYILLKLENWKKLFSVVFFTVGFYQYQGHKLALIPWVGIFVLFLIWDRVNFGSADKKFKLKINWKKALPPLAVLLLSFLIFCFYVLVQLPAQGSSKRVSAMLTPSSQEIINEVNHRRQLSLDNQATKWVTNKYTVWAEEIVKRYSEIFNPDHLFLSSQYAAFNVWTHGLFYLLDAVLIVSGVLVLIKNQQNKQFVSLLLGLILVVPAALLGNGESYLFRSSLSIPLLIILAAVGASYLYRRLPRIMAFGFFGLYIVGIAFFAYQYFVRYPVYASESHYFSDKILSKYLALASSDEKIIIHTLEPDFTYTALVFYGNLFERININKLQKEYRDRTFSVDNFVLTEECVPSDAAINTANTVIVKSTAELCDDEITLQPDATQSAEINKVIGAVKDSGQVYKIYNDKVCQNLETPSYISIKNLSDFDISEMSQEEFCKTWIMGYVD